MNSTTQPESDVNLFSIALAIGRIEQQVSGIISLDERVRKLEQTVERIEAKQSPKTPWYSVVGGISGIAALVVSAVFILNQMLQR